MALAWLQSAVAQSSTDTIWACRDTAEAYWTELSLADTFPDNRGMFKMVDTGAAYKGYYVNFDYQFTNEPTLSKGKTSKNIDTVFTIPPRPGYAGFKFFWDKGVMSFYVHNYDSMVLWHKGPLPGHKVKMIWAQGSAGCGTPINYQNFGEFKSSTEWKRESFAFPALRGEVSKSPDSAFVRKGLFELRMLIYNDDGTTSLTSEKGCLKIDDMYFVKASAAVKNPRVGYRADVGSEFFVPAASGKVTLTVFSLHGEQLFKEVVEVSAGKKYNITKFARKNSNLPAKWISCVQIKGAGVDITRKVLR